MQKLYNIRNFDLDELRELLSSSGEPKFRAVQIFTWLYKKGIRDFFCISDIPEKMRDLLASNYTCDLPEIADILISRDGTKKFIFRLNDGNYIESVLIPDENRNTVCVSTQVGCKYGCIFCASGKIGFIRNLSPAEILGQIICIQLESEKNITNIVFMGMGEPFDNYDAVIKSIGIINAREGMNIGARKIIVSTAGIVPAIRRFSLLKWQVRLAVSLHAADDFTRNMLMPINKKFCISELVDACRYYIEKTGRRLTFEYILIKGINDSEKHLKDLAVIAKMLNADVNIIRFSKIGVSDLLCPDVGKVVAFVEGLRQKGVRATARRSRGCDIMAACGQLAGVCQGKNEKV